MTASTILRHSARTRRAYREAAKLRRQVETARLRAMPPRRLKVEVYIGLHEAAFARQSAMMILHSAWRGALRKSSCTFQDTRGDVNLKAVSEVSWDGKIAAILEVSRAISGVIDPRSMIGQGVVSAEWIDP